MFLHLNRLIMSAGLTATLLVSTSAFAADTLQKEREYIHSGNIKALEKALKANPKASSIQTEETDSLLMSAAEDGNIEAAQLLLKSGAQINQKDESGDTALTKAIRESKEDMVDFLLQKGADVSVLDSEDGNTVLHLAAINRSVKMVTSLLKAGADANVKNNKGQTPLDLIPAKKKKVIRLDETRTALINAQKKTEK